MNECVLCTLAICALLLVASAQVEKEDPVGGSKEKKDIDTKVEIFQFRFEKSGKKNTFARFTIKPEEGTFTSFTLCLSLKIEALEDGMIDELNIFQLLDENRNEIAFLDAKVINAELIFADKNKFSVPHFGQQLILS